MRESNNISHHGRFHGSHHRCQEKHFSVWKSNKIEPFIGLWNWLDNIIYSILYYNIYFFQFFVRLCYNMIAFSDRDMCEIDKPNRVGNNHTKSIICSCPYLTRYRMHIMVTWNGSRLRTTAALNLDQIIVEMLLTLALCFHGIQNRLTFGRIFSIQLFDVALHFDIDRSKPLMQIVKAQKLQLTCRGKNITEIRIRIVIVVKK